MRESPANMADRGGERREEEVEESKRGVTAEKVALPSLWPKTWRWRNRSRIMN